MFTGIKRTVVWFQFERACNSDGARDRARGTLPPSGLLQYFIAQRGA